VIDIEATAAFDEAVAAGPGQMSEPAAAQTVAAAGDVHAATTRVERVDAHATATAAAAGTEGRIGVGAIAAARSDRAHGVGLHLHEHAAAAATAAAAIRARGLRRGAVGFDRADAEQCRRADEHHAAADCARRTGVAAAVTRAAAGTEREARVQRVVREQRSTESADVATAVIGGVAAAALAAGAGVGAAAAAGALTHAAAAGIRAVAAAGRALRAGIDAVSRLRAARRGLTQTVAVEVARRSVVVVGAAGEAGRARADRAVDDDFTVAEEGEHAAGHGGVVPRLRGEARAGVDHHARELRHVQHLRAIGVEVAGDRIGEHELGRRDLDHARELVAARVLGLELDRIGITGRTPGRQARELPDQDQITWLEGARVVEHHHGVAAVDVGGEAGVLVDRNVRGRDVQLAPVAIAVTERIGLRACDGRAGHEQTRGE
jgi:hypothetical protein